MLNLKTLLTDLIAFESITPQDAGCQAYVIKHLEALGFTCERLDNAPVSNFFARFGTEEPLFVLAGHTDVVPVGDRDAWQSNPFELHVDDHGVAYGRGTADMKGSLAAMLIAAERFVTAHPNPTGSLGFLITSGEEGDEFDKGTPYVMEALHQRGITPQYCIVGEPSSHTTLGDTLRVGRRGSLTGYARFYGKQGHVAYPDLAENPIHTLAPALDELVQHRFDAGNAHFPPTSLQITRIDAGGEADNIIPGELALHFNIRYSTEQTAEGLMAFTEKLFKQHGLNFNITWRINGEPFITESGKLLDTSIQVITDHTGNAPDCSTGGGTSDARFIAPYGVEVLELGPINATIHQINECVKLADLDALATLYYDIMKLLLI
jgi:succinyl-diaminopimelate desuccinylase